MNKPTVKSGRFHAGADLRCGENVIIDVAEEVIVGDRVVLPDNAYLGGRRITIGDDCFCYSWEFSRLDVGRGRIDEEDAILKVGSRCTFHNNRIDLARSVTIGNDVGLSPEVAIYTHGYWKSVLDGYPCKFAPVQICGHNIVGFRSVVLPGATIGWGTVIGAQSVVSADISENQVWAGNPARFVKHVEFPPERKRMRLLEDIADEYLRSCRYRGFQVGVEVMYPVVVLTRLDGSRTEFDCEKLAVVGGEDEVTDDFRDFAFRRGLRFFTKRPFRKLPRRAS